MPQQLGQNSGCISINFRGSEEFKGKESDPVSETRCTDSMLREV